MKEIVLEDELGHRVAVLLSLPVKAVSVVIFSHGFTSNKNSAVYVDLERRLNAQGIGSLRYDYYGHGPLYVNTPWYGVSPDVTLTKTVTSLRAVIRHARSLGSFKIGLFGSSFGGLVSLMAASADSDISALVLKSPVVEPRSFWTSRVGEEGIKKWLDTGTLHYAQGPEEYDLDADFWRDVESYRTLESAKSIGCPTLLIHGGADDVVPISQSQRLAEVLGVDVHVVSGANHFYDKAPHLEEMKEEAVRFFLRHLC
jgi:uncharacterized protein